jgi:hypothetical protein
MTQTQLLIRFLPVKFQISVTVDIFIASLYLSLQPHHMSHSFVISCRILPFSLSRSVSAVGVMHAPLGLPGSQSNACVCSAGSTTRLAGSWARARRSSSCSARATRPLRRSYIVFVMRRHGLVAPAKNDTRCESTADEDNDAIV